MDEERKNIIIKEIKYWKANQLLPDRYCNFLLMLYSEGEEAGTLRDQTRSSPDSGKNNTFILSMLSAAVVALILTFIVIYFTSFSLLLQTLSHLILAALVLGMAFYARKRDSMLFHILISAGALILFTGSTVTIMRFEESNVLLHLTILLNCSAWVMAGFYWKLPYLKWAGAAGIILAALFSFAG